VLRGEMAFLKKILSFVENDLIPNERKDLLQKSTGYRCSNAFDLASVP
jgi:hypothetical protein